MNPKAAARKAIASELARAKRDLQKAKREVRDRLATAREAKRTVFELEASLQALSAEGQAKPSTTAKAGRPCATKADVLAACHAIVADNPSIDKEDLKALTEAKLHDELGFSRTMVARHLNRVLAGEAFVVSVDGRVSLAAGAPNAPSAPVAHDGVSGRGSVVDGSNRHAKVD